MKLFGKTKRVAWPGFTLAESVLALIVMSVVILSFNILFRAQSSLNEKNQLDSTVEWHLFLSQLEYTSSTWRYKGRVGDYGLNFLDLKDNKPLTLKFSIRDQGNVIKIQKLNGYEPVLMHVRLASFTEKEDRITLKAVMTDGKEFEADFFQWQKP